MIPQRPGGRQLPAGAVLTVAGDVPAVGALIAQFFAAQGWSVHAPRPGRLEVERGSRRRTVLLGGLAGARSHLSATFDLVEATDGTGTDGARAGETVEVRHRWGPEAGRALGGTVGRARAMRSHQEVSAALVRHLAADGRAVRARPL